MPDELNTGRRGAEQAQAERSDEGPEAQADGAAAERAEPQGEGAPEAGGGADEVGAAVADLERQLAEQRDKYLRLAAEFDNYRKRMARERQDTAARAQGEIVKRLVDSLDDLGRVTSVNTEGVNPQTIIEGVDAVQKKLLRALTSAGLEIIDPVDQPFNPELHEAITTERALSPEDDHLISQVYQPGYVFQGQLLRPARVVVKQWAE